MSDENILKNKKILVVDDEQDVLDTIEELLSMCKIKKALSFEEASEYLETDFFDIAILDIMGVNGYALLGIAKEKKIPAVMLTANALSPENTVKSFKEGAAYYIPKEKMNDIKTYLIDIFDAIEKGKSFWERWLDRFANYYDDKFGEDWKDRDEDFWDNFPHYI